MLFVCQPKYEQSAQPAKVTIDLDKFLDALIIEDVFYGVAGSDPKQVVRHGMDSRRSVCLDSFPFARKRVELKSALGGRLFGNDHLRIPT